MPRTMQGRSLFTQSARNILSQAVVDAVTHGQIVLWCVSSCRLPAPPRRPSPPFGLEYNKKHGVYIGPEADCEKKRERHDIRSFWRGPEAA
jgi:hypothetical protein